MYLIFRTADFIVVNSLSPLLLYHFCYCSSTYFQIVHFVLIVYSGGSRNLERGGADMASAKREPKWGSGGFAPSGVQGQSPWWGARGARPPEAERVFVNRNHVLACILL